MGRKMRTVSCWDFTAPLDFAGKLDGPPDVPAVQVELGVEVFLGCDGCGVVRTGALGHVALAEKYRHSCK